MTGLIILTLLAYLLGSISGSLWLGRLRQVDIRSQGSGNAGGTNAFRTQGAAFALAVVLIDVSKGWLGASLPLLLPDLVSIDGTEPLLAQSGQILVCAMASIVGHCYPIWHGFRGGKGAATAVGAMLVVQPWALIPMISVWLLILISTGLVGLSTVLAAASLIPAFWWLGADSGMLVFAIVLFLFILFKHRANIQRTINGSEYRFEKARLSYWLGHRQ
jgi:glycerol-3-phosphate acyltransferase PlsY